MSMNGIDISNHQAGIDLAGVPFDFVICKATEGTGFVDRYCDGFIRTAAGLGKRQAYTTTLQAGAPVRRRRSTSTRISKDMWALPCLPWTGRAAP